LGCADDCIEVHNVDVKDAIDYIVAFVLLIVFTLVCIVLFTQTKLKFV